MCVRCVDRYPQLLPNINKPDGNETNEELVSDKRRRASEVSVVHSAERMQQQGPPPARGRSDSLPSQKPRIQQRPMQGPQQRPDLQQQRHPAEMQGMRPLAPQPNSGQRPQHPQVRPRYPADQNKGHPGNGQPRPSLSSEPQRFQHPNGQQRFPHPNNQQRMSHPHEQQRLPHPHEQQRMPPPNDQQRFSHPNDQQKLSGDKQPYPETQSQMQQPGDRARQNFPTDPSNSQLIKETRPQLSEIKNQNFVDQRNQQTSQLQRNHPVEQQRNQNNFNNQRNQVSNERKISSQENRPPTSVEQQQPIHPNDQRQQYSIDQQRLQHPTDQSQHPQRPQHPNDQIGPKQQTDQYGSPQRLQQFNDQKQSPANNLQGPIQKIQYNNEYQNAHPRYSSEKETNNFPQQPFSQNDTSIPRPQHPIIQHEQNLQHVTEGTVQSYAPKNITEQDYIQQRLQGSDLHQMTPPPRNQRLRQVPDQKAIPKPQHPQQSTQDIVHYPEDLFRSNNVSPSVQDPHSLDKIQAQQESLSEIQREHLNNKPHHVSDRIQSKQLNNQQYTFETVRDNSNQYTQDSTNRQFDELGNQEERRRQEMQKPFPNEPECLPEEKYIFTQKCSIQNRQPNAQRSNETMQQTVSDNDKNGMYVSLNAQIPVHNFEKLNQDTQRQFQLQHQNLIRGDNSSPSPPATLPRNKPPEAPQPSIRAKRDRQPPTGNQTLPRTGTNPFRTDTNPFRRESLPAETVDGGEYVMVAPRRGSLEDRIKLMPAHDQRLSDTVKPPDPSPRHKDRRLEQQDSFEKVKNVQGTEDMTHSYNRHLDEEQRRNVINSGISAPEPTSRRHLPPVDKQKKHSGVPFVEQGQIPPVPKARTSLPESTMFGENRNGIPRTIPLTSLTLQQQSEQATNHSKRLDSSNHGNKNVINDLSQQKHETISQGFHRQDAQRQKENLVHPNIVDSSMNSSSSRAERNGETSSKSKPPPTQPRKKLESQKEQGDVDPYHGKSQSQPEWPDPSHDQRKSKPIHPNDNVQDIAGYQDAEEEEDIDDYFQMIENAITDRKPQVIAGGRKTSDIQRQLFNKEVNKDYSNKNASEYSPQKGQVSSTLQQIDIYNQNQAQQARGLPSSKHYGNSLGQRNATEVLKGKNDMNAHEKDTISSKKDFYEVDREEIQRDKNDSQYIIQPPDQQVSQEDYEKTKRDYGKTYDKLLLHELTPDTRQPSAKHYLEEHKTQPVSYEAFSSAKAMQQMQSDPHQQQYAMQQQNSYQQQTNDGENRNQQAYYYSQQSTGASYQGQVIEPYDNDESQKGQSPDSLKPGSIDQKKIKPKPDPQDWSPVSDLSPILDVSPSIEAAEQELMEKFQEKVVDDQGVDQLEDEDSRHLKAGGIPRAKSGTISGMLEEFTRALGLPGTSPIDDSGIKLAVSPTSLAMSPISNAGSSVTAVSSIQKEYQEGFGSPQKTAASGSPQKTPAQPTTPRRSHRRLPQPTVEQMQAAVAMAAQGPRDANKQLHQMQAALQSASTTTGAALFGVESSRAAAAAEEGGVSPVTPWKGQEMNQSFEQVYNQQKGQPESQTTIVPPSPAPRSHSRSGNNSAKSNDGAQPVLPTTTQDTSTTQVRRLRSASYAGSSSTKPCEDIVSRLNGGGSSSPHGANHVISDATNGSPQTPSTPRDKTGDSSDTQSEADSIKSVRLRRKLPNLPPDQRSSPSPTRKTLERTKNGSELQEQSASEASSPAPAAAVTVTTTVTTALETSRQYSPLTALGAPSPQPVGGSLSPLLGRRAELARTPSPGGEAGTKLPQYMQSLKQQLRDELKAVTEERKVMLEQRGRERGDSDGSKTPQPLISVQQPSTEAQEEIEPAVTPQPHSPYRHQSQPLERTSQPQPLFQTQMLPQTQYQATPTSQTPVQTQVKSVQQQLASQLQFQTQILSPYRTHSTHHQPSQSYQSQSPAVPQHSQPQSPYQAQTYAQQEQFLYRTLQEGGRKTPQPVQTPADATQQYSASHRAPDDDITIMTTATTTVVSASEQWHDGKRHRQPPTTTMAPSAAMVGSSVESLRRLQSKMSTQPSPKKGRRRHTSEITVPPFPQMEQHEMAHTLHHPPRQQQQQQQTPQYLQQYYAQLQNPNIGYKSMEFKSVDSHVRATDLLRTSASRYGGSLGQLGSTENLYQTRRSLNNRLQDYLTDNRIMEQQQRLVGPDAYFQTLNNEINRLRRSSESLHRDTIYDKPIWGGPAATPQTPAMETRTSPQTTERRKRKEKKARKPRSWHPSPYVSEDEDDQMTREEKKAKIKAEIARRRQQIEENMRLHDELCKLAERRERIETGRPGVVGYGPSPTGSTVSYMAQEQQTLGPSRTTPDGDDTSSVLKAIDEILRKDLYSGPLSRSAWATYASPAEARASEYYQQQGYMTMPARGRYEYTSAADLRSSTSWYDEDPAQQQHLQQQQQQQQQQYAHQQQQQQYAHHQQQQQQQYAHQQQQQYAHHQQQQQYAHQQQQQYGHQQHFQDCNADPETAMDESIARIASTFPTDEPPDILLSATPVHFSPEVTPAMPLLPDMPTRSRKLLENLGSSPLQPSRSGSAQSLYQERSGDEDGTDDGSLGHRMQDSSTLLRAQQRKTARTPVSKTTQKYDFPVKRILLTRDPKDRSVSGNGLGMKVVGGKEVPGTNGMIGAYVAKIFPGGVVETLGEVKEGDQVLEWNGIPLTGRTYEEVQRIIASSADEVEIIIRCDLNMLETLGRNRRSSPGMGTSGGPRGDGPGSGGPPGRGQSPAHSPYSPSPRGQSPALSKRGMGGGGTAGGGGGGNVVGVTTHSSSIPASLSEASSFENLQTPDQGFGHRFGRGLLNTAPTSRSVVSVFAPSDWPDIYDSTVYSTPQSPDDYLEDNFQNNWQSNSNIEEMQFQVCCGPRTAIVYVPIVPVRPMLKSTPSALLNRSHLTRRSVDHIEDYEPLLKNGWRSNDKTLGFYDLLRPRNSLGKVSLYLNGIKEKAEHYDLRKKNGMCRVTEIKEEEHRERPRAPSDLPGLRPVFVNDWKGHKKTKNEENDDNNNTKTSSSHQNGEKPRKPCVGSSPDATPYNILPKGCRGSFCVIL